jgi:hypothetical protein
MKVARYGLMVRLSAMKPPLDPKLRNNPVFQRVLADALSIQERFSAEPVYAKTGKGSLKSAGIDELSRIKAARKKPSR